MDFCDCPLHTLFPMRLADIIEPTLLDLQAACDLIGKDSYGKPHWTPETINPCHPVVQAFSRHARAALAASQQAQPVRKE
jgi:hypothetical protein